MNYIKCVKGLRSFYSCVISSTCTRVFGDEPWKEHKTCRNCNIKYGINDIIPLLCPNCDQELVDFWETGALLTKVNSVFDHERASMWVCQDEHSKDVIGFTWGTIESPESIKSVIGDKAHGYLSILKSDQKIGYQAAVGVLSAYRKQGIAKQLFEKRFVDLCDMGAEIFIVRTNTNSPMYSWLINMGYSLVDNYQENKNDDRVVLALAKRDFKL